MTSPPAASGEHCEQARRGLGGQEALATAAQRGLRHLVHLDALPVLAFAPQGARKALGWPKRCKMAHAFSWECSYERLKLAQLLGRLSVFLTTARS